MLRPLNGRLLVQLDSSEYGEILTTKKEYESTQSGIVIDSGDSPKGKDLFGFRVFWLEYKDSDATFDYNGKKLAFIDYKDIVGYETKED